MHGGQVTTMLRRTLVKAALASGLGLAATGAKASAKPQVVYHLADSGRAAFVLGNIAHHYEGMGGADSVTIALVVHGPALEEFLGKRAAQDRSDIAKGFAALLRSSLDAYACVHTLKAMNLTLEDLLPGFKVAEKGGVVRLAELQGQGYAYLRP